MEISALIDSAKDSEAFYKVFQKWVEKKYSLEFMQIGPGLSKLENFQENIINYWDELVLKESIKKAEEMIIIKDFEAEICQPSPTHPWIQGPWNNKINTTLVKHTFERLQFILWEFFEQDLKKDLKFELIGISIEPDKESYIGYWCPPKGQGNCIEALCYSKFKIQFVFNRLNWISLTQLHDEGRGDRISYSFDYELPEKRIRELYATKKNDWHFEPKTA